PLEEGKYEYSLTRYFDESEPVKVRAYAKDFSAKIEITDEEEDGIISYTVKSTSSDKNSKEEYKIKLKAYSVNSTSLVGIELNGKEIAGFSPDVYEYYIGIKGSYVPDAAAYKFSDKAQVTVSKAEKVPGTTVITVVNGGNTQIYKINFVKILSTNIRHSDFRTMSGIHTYNTKYQVRASTEPMDGGTNIVLYYLFDLNSLGDIAVSNVWLTGTTLTENKLYFYNSTYSEMSEVEAPAAGNFREINDGLVTYLGENKFAKGETATVLLDKSNFEIKDNGKVVIVTRKRAGEINSTDYGEFQNGELKLEYIVKPTADAVISETGDGKFDISVLDKGELTYLSEKEGTLSLDTSWMGSTPKLNLLLNADFLSESKNQNVYVKILKPGINEADDKVLSEKYTYLNTFKLDEMGTLNEIITVDEASGDYKLIVKCENSEKVLTGTFTVPASDKITTLLNNLEDGAYTKDTLYDYLLENKSDLSLESSLINILKADTGKSVCDYLIKNLDVYT
ncbi:MAG: hypothetical protein IKL09_06970, partial [Clostridia bacterium]|nr:hypothetical protein [Clostridia bacterium]